MILNDGHAGWVWGGLLTFTGDAQSVPLVAAPPTPTLAPPGVTELAQDGLITFTSTTLGLSFSYRFSQSGATVATRVDGVRVYVFYTDLPQDGQYVQVLPKAPGDSLQQAIQKQFLSGYDPRDCLLVGESLADDSGYPHLATVAYAAIQPGVPPTLNAGKDGVATAAAQAQKCPPVYTVNGGSVYFMADSAHPDRFFFFKIGQYWIYSNGGYPWQDTLWVLDTQSVSSP